MKKLFLFFSLAVLVACSSEKKDEKANEEKTENGSEISVDRLKELDEEFKKATELDPKKAKEFIGLCMEYADAYADEKDAPEYLEKGALVAGAIKKYRLKTQLLQFIIDKYRGYANYTNVIYLQAVAWDTEMKDAATAKKYYLMVLEQHKDTGILESADARLQTIDSLSYDQHVEMLIKKAESQLQ
jgi:tetratricopeptide (TPR) repeat protein